MIEVPVLCTCGAIISAVQLARPALAQKAICKLSHFTAITHIESPHVDITLQYIANIEFVLLSVGGVRGKGDAASCDSICAPGCGAGRNSDQRDRLGGLDPGGPAGEQSVVAVCQSGRTLEERMAPFVVRILSKA